MAKSNGGDGKSLEMENSYFKGTRSSFVDANSYKWHVFFIFSNYVHAQKRVQQTNLGIGMNVLTENQSARSDILCRATEVKFSYQAWWPVSASTLKAIRGSIKPPCLSWPQRGYLRLIPSRKFLCERAAVSPMWARMQGRAPASPASFTTWRLQCAQGQKTSVNKLFCGCAHVLSASIYVSLWRAQWVKL